MRTCLLLLMLSVPMLSGFAQSKPIEFLNPSFEDTAKISNPPVHWHNCNVPGESPADVQPNPTFGVTKAAYDGETYLGMVVRDNNTWESVSQKMSAPLQKGACYQFEIYLARSLTYKSVSRISGKSANYATPTRLKIWGGFDHCDKRQLLGSTKTVNNTDWKRFSFQFEAEQNYTYIVLEAFYDVYPGLPYLGNVLVDKISELKLISCNNSEANLPKDVNPAKSTEQKPDTAPQTSVTTMSVSELVAIIEKEANHIRFDTLGSLKKKQHTDKNTGRKKWVNLPLQSIIEALNQYQKATITFVIVENDVVLAEKKKQSLTDAIIQLGNQKDRVILRDWQENDWLKVWLGDQKSGVLLHLHVNR